MTSSIVINGSPRKDKGTTAFVLEPFMQGMVDAGCEVELFYTSRLKIKQCSCGKMYCWYDKPGECCIQDDMQPLYPKLKEADILVLATPVYIPLPGDMQNLINRLCPLIVPQLEFRDGRTRARFREDVGIQRIALVSTSGWWELGNFDTVMRIVEELAEDASAQFAGAVLRPHAFLLKKEGKLTEEGKDVLGAVREAGAELVNTGSLSERTRETISQPLISEDELRLWYNGAI